MEAIVNNKNFIKERNIKGLNSGEKVVVSRLKVYDLISLVEMGVDSENYLNAVLYWVKSVNRINQRVDVVLKAVGDGRKYENNYHVRKKVNRYGEAKKEFEK